MSTSTTCFPWWHATFQPLAVAPQTTVSSGCAVNQATGNIDCDPEAMRARAEQFMRAHGYQINVDLPTYTLARYMHSEVGSGTIEERVAVGEAAVNRARLEKLPQGVVSLLLYRQPSKRYGEIQRGGTGRWAATSRDPTILTLLLANLITSGQSGNFNDGADDQDGLEYITYFPSADWKVRDEAKRGKYWVGPLPGVDHWKTWLWRTYGVSPNTAQGMALLQRGLNEVARCQGSSSGKRCMNRNVWPSNMPVCDKPVGWGLILAGLAGTFVGAWAFTRGVFHRAGH
jgi:hypothetical protein